MEFQISSRGLSNCTNVNLPMNFTFKVGKKEYKCNSFQADLISSKVAELHIQNSLADSFTVDVDDKLDTFQLFIDMMNGQEVDVEPGKIQFVRQIAKSIGNKELIERFSYVSKGEKLNIDNAVQILEEKNEMKLDFSEEIDFIAANFYAFPIEVMDCMDVELLDKILSNPNLVLDEEPLTFNFIHDQVTKYSKDYIKLFRNIVFQNIEKSQVEEFFNSIDFEDVTPEIFERVKERLAQDIDKEASTQALLKRYSTGTIDCTLKEGRKELFNGIISFLNGLNPNFLKNKVVVLSSKGEGNSNPPEVVINHDPKANWGLYENPGNYLMINFTQYRVMITGYSFRSSRNSHWDNPQSWMIQGSNNGNDWDVIDKKTNNTEMGGDEKVHHWVCKQSKPYQFIRWYITTKRTGALYIREFELFGFIKDQKKKK